MVQLPKDGLVKGPYKPIPRDCAIFYFSMPTRAAHPKDARSLGVTSSERSGVTGRSLQKMGLLLLVPLILRINEDSKLATFFFALRIIGPSQWKGLNL